MNSIALPDLRVVTPWTASRSGTLLRVFLRDKGQLVTGIRCKALDKECIVALEGHAYGRLITEEDIAGPALDVSNLFELATGGGFVCVHATDPAQIGEVVEQLPTEILATATSVELRHRPKAIPVLPVR